MLDQNKNGTGSYSFDDTNYKAEKCGQGHTLTEDIPQGNATYDAARKNIGSPWMIPNYTQIHELIINTTREWVGGFKFKSNSDTSKYITLPAGGFLVDQYA